MFLKRIQVPEFRALKDVDISFEPEFSPRIFPLGSLNGGGKSTLLQLIFILLTCSGDPEKHIFIQNMLEGFSVEGTASKKLLAVIYLSDNNQDIKLQFVCCRNEIFINRKITGENIKKISGEKLDFSSLDEENKPIHNEVLQLEKKLKQLQEIRSTMQNTSGIQDTEERNKALKQIIEEINIFHDFSGTNTDSNMTKFSQDELEHLLIEREKIINKEKENLKQLLIENKNFEIESRELLDYFQARKMTYICHYIGNKNKKQKCAILSQSEQVDTNNVKKMFEKIQKKVFLASPLTQIFLFIDKDQSKLLFREHSQCKTSYHEIIEETKKQLENFFTYDVLAVNLIIKFIKTALDKDYEQAIEFGKYGNNYPKILKELNSLLGNKKINIDSDLSGVNFKIKQGDETKELYPEDLSHGELKRLSIYVWLKYNNMEDSIVLMDEIENAFHPDWQYQIISDLAEWSPTNQYILATHSYELCQALTPAHVKEIEPKLLPNKNIEK